MIGHLQMNKKEKKSKPKVNAELEGFNVGINSFGEIKSSKSIDDLNRFLNENVVDKKLTDREDQSSSSDQKKDK